MKRETVEEFLKRGGVIKKCPEDRRDVGTRDRTCWLFTDWAWGGATDLAGEPLQATAAHRGVRYVR